MIAFASGAFSVSVVVEVVLVEGVAPPPPPPPPPFDGFLAAPDLSSPNVATFLPEVAAPFTFPVAAPPLWPAFDGGPLVCLEEAAAPPPPPPVVFLPAGAVGPLDVTDFPAVLPPPAPLGWPLAGWLGLPRDAPVGCLAAAEVEVACF